uniref:Uncharacterized protein n=1 Tax=Caenorhabditis japonica TaxID=281687 RepID=A0A8R1ESN8_CAEJA
MVINESKTPGAKSLQNIASARKITSSKSLAPKSIGFEIFQDEEEVEQVPIEERICSPIDTCSRFKNNDSLAADIADDMLCWSEDVVLSEELPTNDVCDSEASEQMALEKWDEYPPIEIASRIEADENRFPLKAEDFCHDYDAILDEDDYPNLYADVSACSLSDMRLEILSTIHEEANNMSWSELIDSPNFDMVQEFGRGPTPTGTF